MYRSRARFLSRGRTLISGLTPGQRCRTLWITFSSCASELFDRGRTKSKDYDRPDCYSHMIAPRTQSRE